MEMVFVGGVGIGAKNGAKMLTGGFVHGVQERTFCTLLSQIMEQ